MKTYELDVTVGKLRDLWSERQFEEAGGAAWLALRELGEPPEDLARWAAAFWLEFRREEMGPRHRRLEE